MSILETFYSKQIIFPKRLRENFKQLLFQHVQSNSIEHLTHNNKITGGFNPDILTMFEMK
jgi:hypothetical protein